MAQEPLRLEKVLLDPSRYFATPADVVRRDDLSHDDKVEILRRWEHDARELQVAEEEAMTGGESASLADVRAALAELGEGGTKRGPAK